MIFISIETHEGIENMHISIRNLLELLYFISGLITAIAALLGLKQLQLLKTDIRTRNERAAREKAIEFSIRYSDIFVPMTRTWLDEQTEGAFLSGTKDPLQISPGTLYRSSLEKLLKRSSL